MIQYTHNKSCLRWRSASGPFRDTADKECLFFCSVEIMLLENQRGDPVSDSDGTTGAHRLVGARPVEHGCGSSFGSVKEKSNRSWGSRGLAPLGCLPHWGREGVTLAISTPAQKTRGDFYRSQKNKYF